MTELSPAAGISLVQGTRSPTGSSHHRTVPPRKAARPRHLRLGVFSSLRVRASAGGEACLAGLVGYTALRT